MSNDEHIYNAIKRSPNNIPSIIMIIKLANQLKINSRFKSATNVHSKFFFLSILSSYFHLNFGCSSSSVVVFFFLFICLKKIKFQHSIHAFHTHYYEATEKNTDEDYRIWKCKYLFRQQMPSNFHNHKKPFSFSSNINSHALLWMREMRLHLLFAFGFISL